MSDLTAVVSSIQRPDQGARRAAEQRRDATAPRGRLDDLAAWLAGAQGSADDPVRPLDRVRLHVLTDGRPAAAVVDAVAADVRVDVRTSPVDTAGDTAAQVLAGVAIADAEADAGVDLLAVAAVGEELATTAAALVGLLTKRDAAAVTPRGATIDDALWMRRCAQIRDRMRRGRPHLGDQVELLAQLGDPVLATTAGLLLGAAARRTPVVLDGVATAAAALVSQRLAFRAADWWLAAQRSPEPAHDIALDRLGLTPLLDLGVREEDGVGALLAVPTLRAAAVLAGQRPGA